MTSILILNEYCCLPRARRRFRRSLINAIIIGCRCHHATHAYAGEQCCAGPPPSQRDRKYNPLYQSVIHVNSGVPFVECIFDLGSEKKYIFV